MSRGIVGNRGQNVILHGKPNLRLALLPSYIPCLAQEINIVLGDFFTTHKHTPHPAV